MFKNGFILKGFGFNSMADFLRTLFDLPVSEQGFTRVAKIAVLLGSCRLLVKHCTGLDIAVFAAFVGLIIAEFYTGLKVARIVRGEKFQSRKFGRMILKIAVYTSLISILNMMASGIETPVVLGIDINPFRWLYYVVFMGIVFQLLISWLENLGALGYAESRHIAGIVLRRFNKWFEFDGSKNNNEL